MIERIVLKIREVSYTQWTTLVKIEHNRRLARDKNSALESEKQGPRPVTPCQQGSASLSLTPVGAQFGGLSSNLKEQATLLVQIHRPTQLVATCRACLPYWRNCKRDGAC
jgi:hypothetical protein